jgi:hypothetical protein
MHLTPTDIRQPTSASPSESSSEALSPVHFLESAYLGGYREIDASRRQTILEINSYQKAPPILL